MEINEDQLNVTRKGYSVLAIAKELATIICILTERNSKTGRGLGKLYSGKKEKPSHTP